MISESGILPASVRSVRQEMTRRAFPAGATIFAEGEVGTVAYILLRGDVTILIAYGTAYQRTVTELRPGQMFGVHALMAGSQRAASALTEHGCELLAVSEAKLRQKLDDADPFLRYWVDYLSKRVIDLSVQ
jgi:CRP/FNR family transcriptional regulator, cyclic AMP receptor protein